jgi:hypothetical protein
LGVRGNRRLGTDLLVNRRTLQRWLDFFVSIHGSSSSWRRGHRFPRPNVGGPSSTDHDPRNGDDPPVVRGTPSEREREARKQTRLPAAVYIYPAD